jgi:CpeT protein
MKYSGVPFLLLASTLLLSSRAGAQPTDLERLASCLTGSFTTTAQARHDTIFRDITLHVVPIWTDRLDGPWLYVEQALTEAPEHPYRQRVYQLAVGATGVIESRVFELPDPVAATYAWKNPNLLAKLNPADLMAREGCTVYLQAQPDGSFRGGTKGNGCESSISGSSYATTEAIITASQTINWDRGYNSNGTQVWGLTHGGYLFQRQ